MIQLTSKQPLDPSTLPGPDTTMKRDAALSSDPRLQAMLAEAVRVGWPNAFQNDLYQHDVAMLAAHPGEPMLWILREHGTHHACSARHLRLPSLTCATDFDRAC